MEAALDDADKAVAPCVGRVDGQQHEEADCHTNDDAQQSRHDARDRALQPAVGKFFLVHSCLLPFPLLAGTSHIQAQLLDSGGLGIKFAYDLTLVHDKDAVGEVHHFVQLQADQQHGLALIALGHDLPVDVFNGADVQAAGGLHCHQQLGVFVDLTGNDGFLLVAAGHAAHDGGAALAAADVVLRDQFIGVLPHFPFLDEAAFLELRLPVTLEHHVVFQAVIQHQTVLVAVFGDMAHAVLGALADGFTGDVLAVQRNGAAGQFFQAGQAVDELGLAVALNARQADDLAAVHLNETFLTESFLLWLLCMVTFFTSSTALPGLAGFFST